MENSSPPNFFPLEANDIKMDNDKVATSNMLLNKFFLSLILIKRNSSAKEVEISGIQRLEY